MITRKKNNYDDFSILCDFENLYAAHKNCRKGKKWKDSVAQYDMRALESTIYLKKLLESGKYQISDYHHFSLCERGSHREIRSTKYRDRVVQKNLCDNIVLPRMAPTFIYDNAASLKNGGTDFQLNRLSKQLRSFYRIHGTDGYILVCDISKFFDSIPHELINAMYEKEFKDLMLINTIKDINNSLPGEKGVPLGNQLSQVSALMVISPIDHMVKENLKIKGYGRYMDDFYLIHEDKEYLKYCRERINQKLNEFGMSLHPRKTKIVPIKTGINFLGFHVYITDSGKVIRRLKSKSKARERQKLRKYKKKIQNSEMTMKDIQTSYDAWKAHAKRGNTYYVLKHMDGYFNELFSDYMKEEK